MKSPQVVETAYRDVLHDDESLVVFLRSMKRFDQLFCELMGSQTEFSLKFEVHGAKGSLIHCRVTSSDCDRPAGARKSS